MLALLVVSIDANQRQARQVSTVTKTSTKTTTSFTTITLTTRTICGNYINATTACRRKRQFWIDRPIVLALDEELDPFVDQILNPSLVLRSGAAHGAVPSIIQFLSLFRTVFSRSRPFFRHGDPTFGNSEVRSSRIERPSLPDIHNLYLLRNGLSPFRS